MLGNQIQKCIEKIVHHNQVELIPGMGDQWDILRSINVIDHINKLKIKKNMILKKQKITLQNSSCISD